MAVFAFISIGLLYSKVNLHILIFIALIWSIINAKLAGYRYRSIKKNMYSTIEKALPALGVLLLIGILIAALMMSGTIASLIYHGLNWLTPAVFLPVGLILCAFMSVITGTSWGTVGTLGLVLVGLSEIMLIPMPLVAGMIVSGATFGDKLSPLSDTTNLTAMVSQVDLYRHIRSMLYTTVPAFFIALFFFWYVGYDYGQLQLSRGHLENVQAVLAEHYRLNAWITFLPLLFMLVLSMMRFAPEIAMTACIISSVLVAVFYQQTELYSVLNGLWLNQPGQTGVDYLDKLLGRGGLSSMSWTLVLCLLALALGGVLNGAGFLRVLIWGLIARIRQTGSLIASTIGCGFLGNVAMGEAYISIILNSQLFKTKYEADEVSPLVLSRSIEEGATQTTALIPWTTAGAFYASTLGVGVLDYVSYAIFNYVNPLIGIVFAYLGIGLMRKSN